MLYKDTELAKVCKPEVSWRDDNNNIIQSNIKSAMDLTLQ